MRCVRRVRADAIFERHATRQPFRAQPAVDSPLLDLGGTGTLQRIFAPVTRPNNAESNRRSVRERDSSRSDIPFALAYGDIPMRAERICLLDRGPNT